MREIKYPVIVEGKYDKIKLSSIFSGVFITTNGFSIFSNEERIKFIQKLASNDKIIIFTDSDGAGHLIRSFIKTCIPDENIINLYTPQIKGKEKRKTKYSKQGFLGVEGVEKDILIKIFEPFLTDNPIVKKDVITKTDLYEWGLSGKKDSLKLREAVFEELNLPTDITTNAFLDVANVLYSKDEIINAIEKTKES